MLACQGRPPTPCRSALPPPCRIASGGCISLDFLDLPVARSGHDFLQVHIDLLTCRVWLVPAFKTATAETAARNYVGSVFRDVGLPDSLVSDHDAFHQCLLDCSACLAGRLADLWLPAPPQHHQQGLACQLRYSLYPERLRRRGW